jgi:hypothetical protein
LDSAWEQEKPKARKMLENAAESPPSTARFVGRTPLLLLFFLVNHALMCSGSFTVAI